MENIGDAEVPNSKRKSIRKKFKDFVDDNDDFVSNVPPNKEAKKIKQSKQIKKVDDEVFVVDEFDEDIVPNLPPKKQAKKVLDEEARKKQNEYNRRSKANSVIEAQIFVPENRFHRWTYSPVNKHPCQGTLAFECRAEPIDYYQSLCHTCKGDWVGLRACTLQKQLANIKWRYGEDIGRRIIINNKSPINYYKFVQDDKVNRFYNRQLKCPKPNCNIHFSFYTIYFHTCNVPQETVQTQFIPYLDISSYTDKHIILTFSRSSSKKTINDLQNKDMQKFLILSRKLKELFNYDDSQIIYGQRYTKKGQCESSIMQAHCTQTCFRSFSHLSNDINTYFGTAEIILLTMKEPGDFSSSPHYIAEFLNSISIVLLPKINFTILQWFDRRHPEVKKHITFSALDFLKLCQQDSLCPVPYFNIATTEQILVGVDYQTRITWNFFESLLFLQEERELIPQSTRNDLMEIE